jgi:hypothetical protein
VMVVVSKSCHRDVVQRSPTERPPTRLGSIAQVVLPIAAQAGMEELICPSRRKAARESLIWAKNQGRIET